MLNEEHLLVPFQVSPLPAGPWLVFAPHADDETFGMGGSLIKAAAAGTATHVVVITDGALGGDAPDLAQTRRREVQRAAALLGLTSVQCWSERDRGLQVSGELCNRVVDCIAQLKPASVFFPGMLELHPDHRNTALLVWAALQQIREAESCPQPFAYEISVQNPINLLIDISAEMAAKEAVMALYASQNAENDYPDLVRALDKARTFTLPSQVSYAEGFFRFGREDLQLPLFEVTRRFLELYGQVKPGLSAAE